jgi:hypothetical protein
MAQQYATRPPPGNRPIARPGLTTPIDGVRMLGQTVAVNNSKLDQARLASPEEQPPSAPLCHTIQFVMYWGRPSGRAIVASRRRWRLCIKSKFAFVDRIRAGSRASERVGDRLSPRRPVALQSSSVRRAGCAIRGGSS